jgi:hypothetical protein
MKKDKSASQNRDIFNSLCPRQTFRIHRAKFTESNAFLRSARNGTFERLHQEYRNALRWPTADAEKRKALRELALSLQEAGLYSSKIGVDAVEHMVLTKLYRYWCVTDLGDPRDNKTWTRFADDHAGPSYTRGTPYRIAVASKN